MKQSIEMHGKPLEVRLTKKALKALEQRQQPLQIKLELLFSCFVAKRVHFSETIDASAIQIHPQLNVDFIANMSSACSMHGSSDVEKTTWPLKNLKPYVPGWCEIDFRDGEWSGEFGYNGAQPAM